MQWYAVLHGCYMSSTHSWWQVMKEYERRETWNIFMFRMSLRERADLFCKKTGRKRCVQLPEDKLLPFNVSFSDKNQPIQVVSWFRSIQEALSWDDRECDLWFYTDGFLPESKECHIMPHQKCSWRVLSQVPNQDYWIWGEFHPREAPAGNWSHFGARAPFLHL